MSFIFVAELVAVVTTHAAVSVDVAACAFKSVTFASAVTLPDIAVVLADAFLIVSPFKNVNWVVDAPPRNVARPVTESVLGILTTPAALIVVDAVAPKVETPMTPSVPFTVAPGVTSKPAAEIVVLAVAPKVETPVAPSVPLKSPLGAVSTPAAEIVVLAVAPKVEMPITPSVPFTVAPGVTSRPAAEIVVLAVAPKVETPVAPSVPLVKMFVLIVVAAWAMPALTKTTARARTVVRTPLPRLFRYVLMLFIDYDNLVCE